MNFYKNTEIHEHYTKNIKEQFTNNSIAVFIKDLRNYQMHYETTFPYVTPDKQVCFETHEFKQYNRWTKLSKEFIKKQGDFIILKPLIETYFKMLEPFYMNIYAELTKYHKQDFKETIELATKINMAIPNIYYKLVGYKQ